MAQILVLEDDAVLGLQIATYLEVKGHEVTLFDHAESAMDYVDGNDIDLVVTDLFIETNGELQKIGGITLINKVSKLLANPIPVVAISGAFAGINSYEATSTATTCGARAILAKPFDQQELNSLIDKLLDGSNR